MTQRSPLSRRLEEARIAAGYESLEAASRAAKVTSGRYWCHEKGEREPRLKFIRRYARVFGVSPGWLAFGE